MAVVSLETHKETQYQRKGRVWNLNYSKMLVKGPYTPVPEAGWLAGVEAGSAGGW